MATPTQTVSITIQGLADDASAETLRLALEAIPGVESADVDPHQARARVTLDPSQADTAQIKAAIEASGYSATD